MLNWLTRRRSYTLAELIVTAGATAVLVGGMASTIVLASRALPENNTALDSVVDASDVMIQITSDLMCANGVNAHTATAIEVTVVDRDNDGSDETIRYEWSGAAGDPLIRSYNGATAVVLLDDVHVFDLGYEYYSISVEEIGPPQESGEVSLASYSSSIGLSDGVIDSDDYYGEVFRPTLPADALSWSITRVWIYARRDGATNGVIRVVLRGVDGSQLPTNTVLGQQNIPETALGSSYAWQSVSFSDVRGLAPGMIACFTLEHAGSGDDGQVRYRGGGVSASSLSLLRWNGSKWTRETDKSLLFYVYGTITTPGVPQTTTLNYLKGVRVTLQPGDDSDGKIETAVEVLNMPEAN